LGTQFVTTRSEAAYWVESHHLGLVFWTKVPAESFHGFGAALGGKTIRILRHT
jgi:hypothetical protein